jgi:hypothetical protein
VFIFCIPWRVLYSPGVFFRVDFIDREHQCRIVQEIPLRCISPPLTRVQFRRRTRAYRAQNYIDHTLELPMRPSRSCGAVPEICIFHTVGVAFLDRRPHASHSVSLDVRIVGNNVFRERSEGFARLLYCIKFLLASVAEVEVCLASQLFE